ncbi:hypothetical protein C9374_009270 [Naegleria lovaniensis]|uniref:Uncharacterized protein n=1 Tax=Naegleria lovaniensis TaxID=51637 RepID=A0AA88GH25_NAELO|nr:uncharacterized protein C9374_009270 [Naegleria lovaniensis]KAG2377359.1 hypothetical protein C9374_009270 [Naegleria lovaniensis]
MKGRGNVEWVEKTLNFLSGGKLDTCLQSLVLSCDVNSFLKVIEDSDVDQDLKTRILHATPQQNDNCKKCLTAANWNDVEGAKHALPEFLKTWATKRNKKDIDAFIKKYGFRYHNKLNPQGIKLYIGGTHKRTLEDVFNELMTLLNNLEKDNVPQEVPTNKNHIESLNCSTSNCTRAIQHLCRNHSQNGIDSRIERFVRHDEY